MSQALNKSPRISVITPSLNSSGTLKRAIESVLAQDYENFEHIIVDGGSTDGTLDILKSYGHLKWISEPDSGQSDAMNKGFARSTGDVIVMLNCDDYFADGAFKSVAPCFQNGAHFVVGNVEIHSYRLRRKFLNKPRVDLSSVMRHWENDAYCYNPVGYFYTRQVQETCPFNMSNAYTMDLEFLLCATARFPMMKIEKLLGYYDEGAASKTTRSQRQSGYWTTETFGYVDKYISSLSPTEQEAFRRDRKTGYAQAELFWKRQEKRILFREWLDRLSARIGSNK